MEDRKLELDNSFFSISKFLGFFILQNLHEHGFPCVDIKLFSSLDDLTENQLYSIRGTTTKQNDFYLPSLLGATKKEIEKWFTEPLDLKKYANTVYPYSFCTNDSEIVRPSKLPICDISGLKFFYHPYFTDVYPGVSGRLMIDASKIVIDVIKPHTDQGKNRKMREMQNIVEEIIVSPFYSNLPDSDYLIEEQLVELLVQSQKIATSDIVSRDLREHTLLLEWSFCFEVQGKKQKGPLQLLFWGLRSTKKKPSPSDWLYPHKENEIYRKPNVKQ